MARLVWGALLALLLVGCAKTDVRQAADDPNRKLLPWKTIGELRLISGKVWVGDSQMAPNQGDGLIVDLPTGTYEVRVQQIDFGGDVRVAKMSVLPPGKSPERGRK